MLEVRYIYDVEGKPVNEYTLRNGRYRISVINLGATITKLIVPNQKQRLENITLRYYNYKHYVKNPYYLGCLIDYDAFKKHHNTQLNMYFDCTVLEDTLKFSYKKKNDYIIVKYSLLENQLLIQYDTNLALNLAHVLFFNLSGNVKDDVSHHNITIGKHSLLFDEIPFFKAYQGYDNMNLLNLSLKDNGINLNITSNNSDILVSFGKYFNKEFYINKKQWAEEYSGIGIVVGGNVSYEFGNH